jgi:hypothetical protein
MKLTGKCKKAFKIWYEENMNHTPIMLPYNSFMGCHNSIKYGVFVDFFDSVGIDVNVFKSKFILKFYNTVNDLESYPFNTRLEARTTSIEKANEIYNNN